MPILNAIGPWPIGTLVKMKDEYRNHKEYKSYIVIFGEKHPHNFIVNGYWKAGNLLAANVSYHDDRTTDFWADWLEPTITDDEIISDYFSTGNHQKEFQDILLRLKEEK